MESTKPRWLVPVLVTMMVLALIGVGIAITYEASKPIAQPTFPTRSPSATSSAAVEPPEPELAEFYGQSLDWEGCRSAYECASLTVPVDYADPTGETVEIALLRVRAHGTPIGSLVVNPGGPGAPGTSYAAAAEQVFRPALLESYDIVGFDPRGTGESSPVDCLSDGALDDYLAGDPDPDDAEEEAEFFDSLRDFGQGCVDNTGDLISHVTTQEAARDMDVLRAALGEEHLDYFGASYGTRLGATYAEFFPDRVGRFVLDGALDVSLSSRDITLGQARGFERALSAYVQACVDRGGCFLGDSVDEGLATIKELLAETDQEPLGTGTDRELTQGRALYGLIAPLYNKDYWYILDTALADALKGDGAGLLNLADLYASRNGDGTYEDNSSEAIFAINCLDDPWAIGPRKIHAAVPEFEEASPTLGRTFAWMLAGCKGQVARSTLAPLDIRAAGAAPIVVIGTTRDPATPYEWAEALAAQLESGVLVSRDGDGHTGYNSGNRCVDLAVEDYLVEGTVPDDGLSC
jgi:pimeloyl-ACP methyl ester carboxylesterase